MIGYLFVLTLLGQIQTVELDGNKAGLTGDMEEVSEATLDANIGCFHNPEH